MPRAKITSELTARVCGQWLCSAVIGMAVVMVICGTGQIQVHVDLFCGGGQ